MHLKLVCTPRRTIGNAVRGVPSSFLLPVPLSINFMRSALLLLLSNTRLEICDRRDVGILNAAESTERAARAGRGKVVYLCNWSSEIRIQSLQNDSPKMFTLTFEPAFYSVPHEICFLSRRRLQQRPVESNSPTRHALHKEPRRHK